MLRIQTAFLSVVVIAAALWGWSELALTLAGCGPITPPPSEGEGEGEDEPTVVGDVSFSNIIFTIPHIVGTTPCPTPIGTLTMTATGNVNRTVTVPIGAATANVLFNASTVLIEAGGAPATLVFEFDCGTTTTFTRTIPLAVTDGATALGTVPLSVTVELSGS